MSDVVKLRTRAEIDEEAAVWTWRLDAGPLESTDQQAYDNWLRQDARHRRAMDELSRVWQALDCLSEAKRDEKIATFTECRAARFTAHTPALVGRGRRHSAGGGGRPAMAAAGQRGPDSLDRGRPAAHGDAGGWLGRGAQHQHHSRDRSVAAGGYRQIFLRKGEAHFQVAHDRTRPFLVHAGDAVVRAVGTEFEVRLRNDQHVDVVVNEGRVEVQARQCRPWPQAKRMTAGGGGRGACAQRRPGVVDRHRGLHRDAGQRRTVVERTGVAGRCHHL